MARRTNLRSFGTIRNSTALKQFAEHFTNISGFGTIRNSTALKRIKVAVALAIVLEPFETAQL